MPDMTGNTLAGVNDGGVQPVDSYLETRGARLRYRDEGHGAAVLLVHGWTLDLDMWNAVAAALARDFRIVRLDRRGFGLSSGEPSIAEDVADLLALCRHLGIDSAALLGMSQGARVVLQFAAAHPRMVSCIILDGPPELGSQPALSRAPDLPYQHYCELAQGPGLSAFREEWRQHPLAQLRTPDPETHALLARMIARYPGKDLINTGGRVGVAAPAQRPESVDRPVLVINGELDLESRHRFGKQLMSQFAHAECAAIPGGGHLCSLDNPSAYHSVLSQFLSRHMSPATSP